jgi:hypothetical protein
MIREDQLQGIWLVAEIHDSDLCRGEAAHEKTHKDTDNFLCHGSSDELLNT